MTKMTGKSSLSTILTSGAVERGEKIAFLGPGWSVTYSELERRTRSLAYRFRQVQDGQNNCVAIVLGRCLEAIESTIAATRAGAIAVPLDPRSSLSELTNLLRHSSANIIVTDSRRLATVCAAAREGSLVITVEVQSLEANNILNLNSGCSIMQYTDLLCTTDDQANDDAIDKLGEDIGAYIHYTSGTTGSPKGVLSSQKSWLWNIMQISYMLDLTEQDRLFWPIPLFHCLGHSLCIIATIAAGASAYLADMDRSLSENLFDAKCKDVTIIVGAPTSFYDLVGAARLESSLVSRLPHLRMCMSAGSIVAQELRDSVKSIFNVQLIDNYGCTEAGGAIAIGQPNTTEAESSCITSLPGWDVQVKDNSGHVVGVNGAGEIFIRGPGLFISYYGETGSPFTVDGWFATGDVAVRLGSTGSTSHLKLIGRKKELIIRGGENISPWELEQVIIQHPSVAKVVVAGISHGFLGEIPAAFITRTPGNKSEIDLISLLKLCRQELPDYKVPTVFYEIDTVPMTLLGKPRRQEVLKKTERRVTIANRLHSVAEIQDLVITEAVAVSALNTDENYSARTWLEQNFDQPFSAFGFNSIASIVLRDRLAGLTGLDSLQNSLVFDYPTPSTLAQYLSTLLLVPAIKSPPSEETPATIGEKTEETIEPIAIISMACRYPGGVSSPEDLWKVVIDEFDATSEFPEDRGWDVNNLYNTDPDEPGTSTTKRGGFVSNFADFDADLFGMAPKEALATDPQQRLLLETTWQLAERAGMEPSSLRGSQTGVFAGFLHDDYEENGYGNNELEAHLGLGSSGSVLSGRISYSFGLHGPSIAVSTGCSSSSVAIHLAAQSLRNQECSLAIAGGVTIMATPRPFAMFSRRRGLSPDGRCRAFSSDADGTGWSEGVGLILLERLSDAKKNGHRILALIRGSAVNSNGASNGLTAPSGPAQQRCIESALAQARLSPLDVHVLEGHGTATRLGDPIEAQAIIAAYGNRIDRRRFHNLLLGSIKSNIGHTQAAAGVAGVIKMVLATQHGYAPASLYIRQPSTQVNWTDSGVELLRTGKPWPSVSDTRRSAVSSFGIGGTNSHIILEGTRQGGNHPILSKTVDSLHIPYPWILSGTDQASLKAQARTLLEFRRQQLVNMDSQCLLDISFTLATARSSLRHRAVVLYPQNDEEETIQGALTALSQDQFHSSLTTGNINTVGRAPRLAFLFSGQGGKLPQEADLKAICDSYPTFLQAFDAACAELEHHMPLDPSIRESFKDCHSHKDTLLAQVALFAFEIGMYFLLKSFNLEPDIVVGHSLGEIVAAYASGSLSLSAAAFVVVTRAKLLSKLPPNGAMLSIEANETEVIDELLHLRSKSTIAAVNSLNRTVVSGPKDSIMSVAQRFTSLGRRTRILENISHAFHSRQMNDMLPDLKDALQQSSVFGKGQGVNGCPIVSTMTGTWIEGDTLCSAEHWVQHIREPVRFLNAIQEIQSGFQEETVFLEVGPSSVLAAHVPGALATCGTVNQILNVLGQLWIKGVQVDWSVVFRGSGAKLTSLPTYSFQRRKFWLPFQGYLAETGGRSNSEACRKQTATGFRNPSSESDILTDSIYIAESDSVLFYGSISISRQPWLQDHLVDGQALVPAAAIVDILMSAGQEISRLFHPDTRTLLLDELVMLVPIIVPFSVNSEKSTKGLQEISIQLLFGEAIHHDAKQSTYRKFEIFSRFTDTPRTKEQICNACGTLSFSKALDNGSSNDFKIPSLEPITPADSSNIDITRAYNMVSELGVSYGPFFKVVKAISVIQKDHLQVHVEIADNAVLHAPILASSSTLHEKELQLQLPFSIRGLQMYEVASEPCHSYVAEIFLKSQDKFSLVIKNSFTQAVVAEVSEVQLRPRNRASEKVDIYHLQWTEISRDVTTLETASIDLVDVFEAASFQDVKSNNRITSAVHEAVSNALDAVLQWNAKNGGHCIEAKRRLVCVTRNATVDQNLDSTSIDLVSTAVWGFVRSFQAEMGSDRITLIDIDGSIEANYNLNEAIASGEEVIALRGETMQIPQLVPYKSYSSNTSKLTTTLDVSGTVLITGGTGGLGELLSRYLVSSYEVKHLLLVSRIGLEATGASDLVEELEASNVNVRIEACDVSSVDQLETLFQRHAEQCSSPPITAVIHCAGVLDDGLVVSQTRERISQVLLPKVDAAWNLHELMPNTVNSFVLFSSVVGMTGNEGQAAYAAANSFLNGLARMRSLRGLPALSLAYGPWANDRGMASKSRLAVANLRFVNAKPLSNEEGLEVFDRILKIRQSIEDPLYVPLMLTGPFPMVNSIITRALSSSLNGKGNHTKSSNPNVAYYTWLQKLSLVVPGVSRHKALMDLVKREVAMALGHEDHDMLPDKSLSDMGFDSFTSVLLTNRFSMLTGLRDLPSTLALDHDTLVSLVDYLLPKITVEIKREFGSFKTLETTGTAKEVVAERQHIPIAKSITERPSLPGYQAQPNTSHSGDSDGLLLNRLSKIHKRLCDMDQYTAAADLLASASLVLPQFPEHGANLSQYSSPPHRLATSSPSIPSSIEPVQVIFIEPFFPRVKTSGVVLSIYSSLAARLDGKRDVFELSHPEGQLVPRDLETLADVHVHSIRKFFSPTEKIIIAGYSAGGAVAYAVASRFVNTQTEDNDQPRLVGVLLIDTYLNMTGRGDPDWLNALGAETLVSRLNHAKYNVESLFGNLDVALAKVGGYFRTLVDLDSTLYPLPSSLKTLFVCASKKSEKMPDDEEIWKPRWPQADLTTTVPGSHCTLLDRQFTPRIAEEIEKWIKEYLIDET